MAGEGLALPKQQVRLDALVSDYNLWASGEGRSVANNTLAHCRIVIHR